MLIIPRTTATAVTPMRIFARGLATRRGRTSTPTPPAPSAASNPSVQGSSSSASTIDVPGSTSPPLKTTPASSPSSTTLTWPEYLRLHRIQYRLGLWTSIPGATIALLSSASYVATLEVDPTSSIIGLDPMAFYMACVLSSAIGGFLLSPILGRVAFNAMYGRKYGSALQDKESEFFHRISRNRVDPRYQSVSNPVPDYYGEKIGSLKDYRQWLRDQRAYEKKAGFREDRD